MCVYVYVFVCVHMCLCIFDTVWVFDLFVLIGNISCTFCKVREACIALSYASFQCISYHKHVLVYGGKNMYGLVRSLQMSYILYEGLSVFTRKFPSPCRTGNTSMTPDCMGKC